MNHSSRKPQTQSYNITYDELLTLLLRRENEYKTLLEYAIETKTIKPDILIKILNHQNQNHCTLQESFTEILGDNFTKKYLKIYASQVPPIYSIWTDQAPFIKKLTKTDQKNSNIQVYNLDLDANSNLNPVELTKTSTEQKITNIKAQNSHSPASNNSINPKNVNSSQRNYFESDEDDDEFEISAYEEPELVGKSPIRNENSAHFSEQAPTYVTTSLTAVDSLAHDSDTEIDELDISETTKALKELSHAERESSGFQMPALPFEPIDKSLLSDFLEFFDDHQRTTIENLILSIQNKSGKDLSYVFNSLYREFHSLKGSSRFCKLKLFEMITHYMEDLITDVQQKMTSFDKATRNQFEESLLLGMDVLWELKHHIQEHKSERSVESNNKLINKTHHLWLAIAKTRFNLRFSAAS